MKIQLLACAFLTELVAEIGLERVATVRRLNQDEVDNAVCHSHDYCDANMVMLEAFKTTFGREPGFLGEALDGEDLELVNKAWDLAKILLCQEFK